METNRHIVSVFGSSRPAPRDPEYGQAMELGAALARAGFTLCNGGYGGIMEASARGAKEAGGSTIGVISSAFPGRSVNRWVDEVVVEDSLVSRLLRLVSLGEGYVVLKGGTGTLLEFAAVWEFMNKRMMHEKPIVLLGEFWGGVVATLKEELAWEGLSDCTKYVGVAGSPGECATILRTRLLHEEKGGTKE